jgi:hypothetical protein
VHIKSRDRIINFNLLETDNKSYAKLHFLKRQNVEEGEGVGTVQESLSKPRREKTLIVL